MYPAPEFVIVTFVIFPFTIVGTRVAVTKGPVPKNCKSASVSTVESYKPVCATGAGSFAVKVDKSISSTIKFLIKTSFARCTNCFVASALFLNQLCLGVVNVPYLTLSLNSGSGTGFICASYPIKLLNQTSSISLGNVLVPRFSETRAYSLWTLLFDSVLNNLKFMTVSLPFIN